MPDFRPATVPIDDVLHQVDATKRGLTQLEVDARLQQFGPNTLPTNEASSSARTFFRQFESSLVIIMLIATVVSFFLGDHLDAIVILAAVFLNVLVGFFQERRAERALAALQKVATFTSTVLRDGRERDIASSDVVPGDVLVLHAGQKVAADSRLLEVYEFEANEAALTGESAPVEKQAGVLPEAVTIPEQLNMAFAGTVITRGRGLAIVTTTGLQTELGKIAQLLDTTVTEKTPLQRRLVKLSRNLAAIILVVAALVFLLGLFRLYDIEIMFTTAVAIAVASIPEGLAVVVTIALALGMTHMLKQRALARSLLAAEALGSVTVIATDKTGTVTEGYMRVVQILTHDRAVKHPHRDPGEPDPSALTVLKIAALASDATIENPDRPLEEWDIRGNLTERALVRAAAESGFNLPELRRQYTRLGEVPFDSSRRFMAALLERKNDGTSVVVKGAPEVLFANVQYIDEDGKRVAFTPERRREWETRVRDMSAQGLRALAVGERKQATDIPELTDANALHDLTLVGVVGIQDPLRSDAKETIQILTDAGIRTVMLTGDNRATALAIAKGLQLASTEEEVMDGRDLEALDAQTLQERVANIRVFARVSPKDKLRIIDALQARGEVVAMTGDGVNDAPALKAADIGVALGSGTDVAKEAADLVLLDNNLRTISNAVFEGRVIYRNIKRIVLYLLSGSFAEFVIICAAVLLGWPLPMVASQILWNNLVTDGLPTIALTQETEDAGILKERPIKPNQPIVGPFTLRLTIVMSVVIGLGALGLFWLGWDNGRNLSYGRTLAFAAVGISTLLCAFSARTLRHPLTSSSPLRNPSLLLALGMSLMLQLMAIYLPLGQKVFGTVALSLGDWVLILAFAVIVVAITEMSKVWFRKRDVPVIAFVGKENG